MNPTEDRRRNRRTDRSLHWFIASRYLSSRRGRGFLSLITLIAIGGVSVGVMALIVVIGVMSGLQTDLREKILGSAAVQAKVDELRNAQEEAAEVSLDDLAA